MLWLGVKCIFFYENAFLIVCDLIRNVRGISKVKISFFHLFRSYVSNNFYIILLIFILHIYAKYELYFLSNYMFIIYYQFKNFIPWWYVQNELCSTKICGQRRRVASYIFFQIYHSINNEIKHKFVKKNYIYKALLW